MPDDSTRTVLVALGAGLGVALAKVGAAAVTGSTAMAAEAAHSLADSGNDLFLFRGSAPQQPPCRRSASPGVRAGSLLLGADRGPRRVFTAAAFTLREGVDELIHPSATSSFAVAYVVLAISTVLDLVSIHQSAGQMARRARRYHLEFVEESRDTSDPSLRAVFVEDVVSIAGDVTALAALALNQITGSSIPQGVAAVLIALVIIRVSMRLIQRSHDFLVGSWAGAAGRPRRHDVGVTQPFRPADEERARAFLLAYPGVTAIRELLFTFVGPGQVWIVARIDIDDGLRGAQVEALVRGIESGMKHEVEDVYRVDVVPIGEAQPASS